jgi:hypothetical protein
MAMIPEFVGAPVGVAITGRDAAAGDTIVPTPRTELTVDNTSATPMTVTVAAVKTCSQGSLHDSVTVVAAGARKVIGPIDERYARTSDGLAAVSYSATPAGGKVYTTRT